jgi:hypothetical protein
MMEMKLTIGLGVAILVDYDSFSQDANSKEQIGIQDDQWDARSVRFFASGGIGPKSYRVSYLASEGFNTGKTGLPPKKAK